MTADERSQISTPEAPPEHAPEHEPEHAPLPASEHDLRWRRVSARNPRFRVFLIIAGIVLVVVGFFVWRFLTSYESTDDAQIDGHLNPISARISGHVVKLLIEDNQVVQAGQPLVQIDPVDYDVALHQAQADYDQAVAAAKAAEVNVPITSVSTGSQMSTAQADVENARAGISVARQQLDAARAQQQQAVANNDKAQNDLVRYRQLVEKQEISQQQYDQAVAAAKASAAGVEAARATTAAAQQQITQAQAKLAQAQASLQAAGTAPQQVESIRSRAQSARAQADLKRAALDKAKLYLQYTVVIAPVAGIVSNRTVEVGQNVSPGQQLLTIIPIAESDIWVTANFKENQLADMRVGQRVTIHVDATDKDYDGHVQSVAGAAGARFSLLPPENATGNYVKVVQRIPVKITFDRGQDKDEVLRPGMSAEPKVWIR
jgi:membrane fusion protein (multidrug efflux system)